MKTLGILPMILIALILSAPVVFGQGVDPELPSPLAVIAERQVAAQDTSRPPSEDLIVDRDVIVIEKKEPIYPALAKKAGLEGKVWVKIWVNKEGRPRDVQLLASDAEIFNKCAIEASWSFRFKPALIKDNPVDVWVTVPFKFVLAPKVDPIDQSYNSLTSFVRDVLTGKTIDSASIRKFVYPEAYAALGGKYIHLMDAVRRQVGGDHLIDQPNRKIEFASYHLNNTRDASFMTIRTEGKGKASKPRYHTVVFFADNKGEWTIRGWQSSQ